LSLFTRVIISLLTAITITTVKLATAQTVEVSKSTTEDSVATPTLKTDYLALARKIHSEELQAQSAEEARVVAPMSKKLPNREIPSDPEKRCPQFEPAFEKYGLPVEAFSYIAWRESRCRIKAINIIWDAQGNIVWALNKDKSYDSGLLQINSSWKTVTRRVCGTDLSGLMILDCNLRVAKFILENSTGGLGNWRM